MPPPPDIETIKTVLAEVKLSMFSPGDDAVVAGTFAVKGTAVVRMQTTEFIKHGGVGKKTVTNEFVTEGFKVSVAIGKKKHDATIGVKGDTMHWSHLATASSGPVSVTATLSGTVEELHDESKNEEKTLHLTKKKAVNQSRTRDVVVDADPPQLTIDTVEAVKGPPYSVKLSGTASDVGPLASVVWRLEDSAGVIENSGEAENVSGDWTEWRAEVPVPDRQQTRTVFVSATDRAGNQSEEQSTAVVADAAPPVLAITKPPGNPHETLFVEGGITVPVEGTAEELASLIDVVRWRLNGGEVTAGENVSGTWSLWRLDAAIDEAGTHEVTIEAVDAAGNVSPPLLLTIEAQVLG